MATSLVIISLVGAVALGSHIFAGTTIAIGVTAALAGSTGVGALLGTVVASRLPQAFLGKAFAVVVTLVAVYLLVDTLALGGPPGS